MVTFLQEEETVHYYFMKCRETYDLGLIECAPLQVVIVILIRVVTGQYLKNQIGVYGSWSTVSVFHTPQLL